MAHCNFYNRNAKKVKPAGAGGFRGIFFGADRLACIIPRVPWPRKNQVPRRSGKRADAPCGQPGSGGMSGSLPTTGTGLLQGPVFLRFWWFVWHGFCVMRGLCMVRPSGMATNPTPGFRWRRACRFFCLIGNRFRPSGALARSLKLEAPISMTRRCQFGV